MRRGTRLLRFGPVRQEAGAKHVQEGTLLEAINVRQTAKAGVYAKRKGFARTAQTFAGGFLSGTPASVVSGPDGSLMMTDTGGQCWVKQATSNQWVLSGQVNRPWVDTKPIVNSAIAFPQPTVCAVLTNTWIFTLTPTGYAFVICDANGNPLGLRHTVTATGCIQVSAVYVDAYVWVFWISSGTGQDTVWCHKILPNSPDAAPVATTYYTFAYGGQTSGVHAAYLPSLGGAFVVASRVGGGSRDSMHSLLNTATGLPSTVAGHTAQTSHLNTAGLTMFGGIRVLDGQSGSGTIYYVASGEMTNTGVYDVGIFGVSASNFASFSLYILDGAGSAWQLGQFVGNIGFVDGSGNQIVIATKDGSGTDLWSAGSASYCQTAVYMRTAGGTISATSTYTSLKSCWGASGFVQYNGSWYFLAGYDDAEHAGLVVMPGGTRASLQRSFQLREFIVGANASACTFPIRAQFAMGGAAAIWNKVTQTTQPSPAVGSAEPAGISELVVQGSNLFAACAMGVPTDATVSTSMVAINTAKTFGGIAYAMGRAFVPGNVPTTFGPSGTLHEAAPLVAPAWIYQSGGSGSTWGTTIAAVYAIYDEDGTVWRSAPVRANGTVLDGATIKIPNPVFALPGTTIKIELYAGNGTEPKLQTVIAPTAGQAYSSYTASIGSAPVINGSFLYTTGNALSATWPVPCQAVGSWRNRVFLASKNVLWYSKELEDGFGPLWNEALRSIWSEELSDVTALAPVDWNYLAVMSEGQTAVISGEGPDGLGHGNYLIRTLPSYTGVAAGGAAIQGAQGCYYQNKQTGRIMVVTPDLRVVECAGGAYDYAGYVVTAAAWYEGENLLLFFAPASRAAIVIDYQHPQQTAPFGQVYLWTFAAGFSPAVVTRDNSGLAVIGAAGSIYRPSASQLVDDNSGATQDSYQMKLASAELQLADIQGAFTLEKAQVLLTMHGASGVSVGVYPGYASATLSDPDVSTVSIDLPAPTNDGDPESVMTRPPNCARIESFRMVVQEKAGITGPSFDFEGFGVEYTQHGGLWRPAEGRII